MRLLAMHTDIRVKKRNRRLVNKSPVLEANLSIKNPLPSKTYVLVAIISLAKLLNDLGGCMSVIFI